MPRQKQLKIAPVTPVSQSEDASVLEQMLNRIPEGRASAIAYARQLAFKDDRYKDLIREFDNDRKQDLGELCRKHEIAPQDFMADINREAYPVIEEAMRFAKGIAQGIVAERLPKVVHRGMIEGAKKDGIADRHFTLQKEGFHVAPKGTVISMTQVNQQAAGLDAFEDDVKAMASILGEEVSEDHLLTEGDADYIDAEIEEKVEEEIAV